jgi:histidyl-tRNA synthetase
VAEAEVLTAAADALGALGFTDYVLRLNDRQLLKAIADNAGIPEPQHGETLVALDKRDKLGEDGVRQELAARGIGGEAATILFDTLAAGERERGPRAALAAVAAALVGPAATLAAPAVARLDELLDLLAASGFPEDRLVFDAALARGLGYYTGPIFEVALPGFAGSVAGGGRYDDLVGMFLGRKVPACGISLGVERLLMILEERGMFPESLAQRDVFVTRFRGVSPAAGLRLAALLRAAGLEADVFPDDIQLTKQLKLAEQSGARVIAVIGHDEAAAGHVTLKRAETREQVTVPLAEAAATVANWLSA